MTIFTVIIVLLTAATIHGKALSIDLYPGYGWDDLRYLDMLPIFNVRNSNSSINMQECIAHIPKRRSQLELSSKVIDIYDSSSSSYTKVYTTGGGLSFLGFGISASYSEQYQQLKEQQGRENTVTIRNEIEHILADVLLVRSCQLDSQFKTEIIDIANYIKTDEQIKATYAAQLLVLRYGTHYTSRFRIGGRIVDENFMKSQELYASETIRKSSQASAKASFILKLSLSASYQTDKSLTTNETNQFQQRITQNRITSEGGQPFLLNMSIQNWQLTVEDNPIILQRMIENITAAIDPKQIPEIEEHYVYKAIEEINKAIDTYVRMNLIRGCTKRDSSSFNWLANINDGSCTGSSLNIQFGGFIRTCSISWSFGESSTPRTDLCNDMLLKNFHTNTEDCPLGFTKQLLHTSSRSQRYERTHSYSCGFLWLSTCYRQIWVGTAYSTSSLYTCVRNGTGLTQYTFGGSYTANKINLVTNERSCPLRYQPVRIVNDIDMCVTQQIIDSLIIPKFGGLFSCQTASPNNTCPSGFSAYVMGVIEGSCILHVCLQLKTQDIRNLPQVSLPPFFNLLEFMNLTEPNNLLNESNITDGNNAPIPTIRMSPRFIQQDMKSASTTFTPRVISFLMIFVWHLMSYIH